MPNIKQIYVWTNLVRPTSWDMSKWTLAQTSSALSWTWWGWVSLKPDGTRLYLSHGNVEQYNLSTPFNISSLTSSYTLSTSAEDIYFKPDWTALFVMYNDGQAIYKYTLSTAWDLSTATYSQQKATTSYRGRGLYLTTDGKKIFYSWHQNYARSYVCTLSTARDLSTASSWTQTLSNWAISCWFGNNWKMYFEQINETTTDLTYLNCSTPYDLSTATAWGTKNVWKCRAWGIRFDEWWTMCFMVWGWSSTNYVTKYTL